jgi:AbrB family looped-hinge helix DNA binding protein
MQPSQIDQLIRGLSSVSDKIRALDRAGYARADIAKYLGKRYQHVRNVLEQDKARRAAASPGKLSVAPAKARLGGEGRIVIPASFREAIGVKEGDVVFLRLEGREIHLSPIGAVTQRVRALLREFVPPGTSLVDELIAERRREASRESDDE